MLSLASEFSSVLTYVIFVGNRPAENALPNLSATAVVPGSWVFERRSQLNEESDCDSSLVAADVNVCYTFPANVLHGGVSLYLGSIN